VALLARGAALQAIRQDGLRVESSSAGSFTARVTASDDPDELGVADAVLVAVKAWQVAEVAERIRPLLGASGIALPLQNGLEARDHLARALGDDRAAAGLCYLFAFQERPGVIRHNGPLPSALFGEWSGASSERLEKLCATLKSAGIAASVSTSIRAALWEKALFVESLGAVGAVLRLPVGAWRAQAEPRALLEGAMRETWSIARAQGLALDERAIAEAMKRADSLPADATASMQRDIVAGRLSELDDQTGAILRAAESVKVDAPIHRFLLACLLPHERIARAADRSGTPARQ
jgi:2-dehydropantoate 2-reductase